MKKITMILIAFVLVTFTQCKPEPEGNNNGSNNDDNINKVKISCTIPINKGNRSDFTGLFEDGVINWSDGRECVYLAIPGDDPKIVELEAYCDGYKPEIEFIAYADENLLTAGESYDLWYFGHSQQLDSAYVSLVNGNKIEGSIAKQTGRLEDLGYSHIASTSVTAVIENGEVKLPLIGTLKNRMAIALLDLENLTTGLFGSAVNTDYTLEYNAETGRYEFNVIEDENASIEAEPAEGISYIAFLPNDNNKVELRCRKNIGCEYVFYNGINENKVYHRTEQNGGITSLKWQNAHVIYEYIDGHECVDLGLPSGLKWATYNVGANSPEEYGDYYAWGETTTKERYDPDNCQTYDLSISKLQSKGYIDETGNLTSPHDAATANWGGNWRMPTYDEIKELKDNCTLTKTTENGVNGYKVTGTNANSIFLPSAGYRYGSKLEYAGSIGVYFSSTPKGTYDAHYLGVIDIGGTVYYNDRPRGQSIRPVTE